MILNKNTNSLSKAKIYLISEKEIEPGGEKEENIKEDNNNNINTNKNKNINEKLKILILLCNNQRTFKNKKKAVI